MRPRRPSFDARARLRASIALLETYVDAFDFHADGRLDALDAGRSVEVHAWELDLVLPNDRFRLDPDDTVFLIKAGDSFEPQV